MDRRTFLRGAGVGAAALAFDVTTRSFVTRAEAVTTACMPVPPLDGVLLTDPASIALASDDYGHIVHHAPRAVLRPGSVDDVMKIVRYARGCGIHVSMRGQGNSTYGQAQVLDGIVIDSSTLNTVHAIGSDRAVVDAGVPWRVLVEAAATDGRTPPALTDYLDLTVGGTLSLGGLSASSYRTGYQVDNVLELEVVTGRGDLVRCSPTENAGLFDAALAGLGVCAIIVRATVRLVPMPTQVVYLSLTYWDLQTYLDEQASFATQPRFSEFQGRVVWETDTVTRAGRWRYIIDVAQYVDPGTVPDTATLTAGLRDDASKRIIATMPYLAWTMRLDPTLVQRRADGSWFRPHVWFLGYLPEAEARSFLTDIFATFTSADVGGGAIGVNPLVARPTRPLLAVPTGLSFGLLLSRQAATQAEVDTFLASNRELYDELVARGGKRYPCDAIPDMSGTDWRRHYGDAWGFLVSSKRSHDPDGILGIAHGMFATKGVHR